jgi:hypothetical protein
MIDTEYGQRAENGKLVKLVYETLLLVLIYMEAGNHGYEFSLQFNHVVSLG